MAIERQFCTFHLGALKLGLATDLGHAGALVMHHLRDCDLLVVESNHDPKMLWASGRPPHIKQRILSRIGHLSNDSNIVSDQNQRHVLFFLKLSQ